jgi:chromosome segregation ATPase
MEKKRILVALAMIFIFVLALNAEAGQVYTWTDEHGNLHITNSPPPKTAKIKEVLPYQQKSVDEIQTEKQLQKKENREDLKEKQDQQIQEARRKARDADQRAKEAVARAEQITQDNNTYIKRLGSTREKRKQFRKKIQRLKDEAVLAQEVANSAIEEARRSAEAVQELEEEIAGANQQPQKKADQPPQTKKQE